jgi:hypothetical protein
MLCNTNEKIKQTDNKSNIVQPQQKPLPSLLQDVLLHKKGNKTE